MTSSESVNSCAKGRPTTFFRLNENRSSAAGLAWTTRSSSSTRMTGVASKSRPEKALGVMSGQCGTVDAKPGPAALSLRRRTGGLLDVAELFLQRRNILLVPLDLILVLLQPVENPLVILLVAGPDRFLLGQLCLGLRQRFFLAAKLVLQN